MDPVDAHDVAPPRPGVAPRINLPAAGVVPQPTQTPQWHRITPALVRILQAHFSVATQIEDPNLVARVWTNQPSSPIVISSLAEWNPGTANNRPAILVDRLEQNRDQAKAIIGDQQQGVRPGSYAVFMTGAHVVHAIGGREGEADILAKEIWRELAKFAPIIAPRLCLNRMRVMGVGKRTELTEHKQIYTVPVAVVYDYIEQWRVYPTDEAEVTRIFGPAIFGDSPS